MKQTLLIASLIAMSGTLAAGETAPPADPSAVPLRLTPSAVKRMQGRRFAQLPAAENEVSGECRIAVNGRHVSVGPCEKIMASNNEIMLVSRRSHETFRGPQIRLPEISGYAFWNGIFGEDARFEFTHDISQSLGFVAFDQGCWKSVRAYVCFTSQKDKSLAEFQSRRHPERKGLESVGNCIRTQISGLGYRLGPGSGHSVQYDNGLGLVGYDEFPGIGRSHLNDDVKVCLVSIPRDCPADDDAGREYETTNLRTGDSWKLLDSPHMCGGA